MSSPTCADVIRYAKVNHIPYKEAEKALSVGCRQVSPYFARDERLLLVERVKG